MGFVKTCIANLQHPTPCLCILGNLDQLIYELNDISDVLKIQLEALYPTDQHGNLQESDADDDGNLT